MTALDTVTVHPSASFSVKSHFASDFAKDQARSEVALCLCVLRPSHRLPAFPSVVGHRLSSSFGHGFIRIARDAGQRAETANASDARRRATPGGVPVKRLNARLNAASDP